MKVYLDNAATTPLYPEVLNSLNDLLKSQYINADSLYQEAAKIKELLEKSRSYVSSFLGVKSDEIIFTSGASEGNNLIIRGVVDYYRNNRKHLITTNIEHSSVKSIFNYLESIGYQVDRINIDKHGNFDFKTFKEVLRKDTLLVSIMSVNNEVGTILPIFEIFKYTKENSQAFTHTDATQSLTKIKFDQQYLDFASFSAHKFGGLKGSGFIYKRNGTNLLPLIIGGQQEFGYRAGTSNYHYHILLAKTLRLANSEDDQKIVELNNLLRKELSKIEEVSINSYNGSPYITNFYVDGLGSQILINALDKKGFMISGQSTCSTRRHEYSEVLVNMGFSMLEASNSIRVSFWHQNKREEVLEFIKALKEVIKEYGK